MKMKLIHDASGVSLGFLGSTVGSLGPPACPLGSLRSPGVHGIHWDFWESPGVTWGPLGVSVASTGAPWSPVKSPEVPLGHWGSLSHGVPWGYLGIHWGNLGYLGRV